MYYRCQGMKEKESRLAEILSVVTVGQCIVFVHTREAVDKLAYAALGRSNPRLAEERLIC